MTENQLLRLKRIQVDRLFNIYDHDIKLNLDERITLLHGPNGVGKTVILRMVNSLLQKRLDNFLAIPFKRFLLEFHDGSVLELSPENSSSGTHEFYRLSLQLPDDNFETIIDLNESNPAAIARKLNFLNPLDTSQEFWIDVTDGEVLSGPEILARFGGNSSTADLRDENLEWFASFLKRANAHFFDAQRLVRIDLENVARRSNFRREANAAIIHSVTNRSNDFRKRLDDTMAQYGRLSLSLDQSFPERLISLTDQLQAGDLREQMTLLDNKTAEYKSIGIFDEAPTHPFRVISDRDIDDAMERVMKLYVSDIGKKLEVLDNLAKRTRLLLDNVNKKFRHKRIRLDRENGFVAEDENGKILPLGSLSSGEQHELVLHYDLLFKVPTNTIVLIDEPELSLHVAWQKQFLPDLLEIVQLSDFDALVATHSPFIVGEREELMVGLGGLFVDSIIQKNTYARW